MSSPPPDSTPSKPPPGSESPGFGSIWQSLSLIISLALASVALAVLYFEPYHSGEDDEPRVSTKEQAVQVTGPDGIHIKPGSSFEGKLKYDQARLDEVKTPLLMVTGSIVARLGPGADTAAARWDFVTADLANSYVDWLKARDEVAFADKQFETVKELAAERMKAQTAVVERLEKLVAAKTDPEKDLAAARADLVEKKLQGQKDIHEADTAKKNAMRNRSTLERQLHQAGVDPELLLRAKDNLAIVVAEVPEAKLGLVEKGMKCDARFFAFPNDPAAGRVGSVSPTLSKERRTLRAFFELPDSKGRFKPGMFAEVFIGTDPRKVTLIPSAAVLHVGKFDYVFTDGKETGNWKVTPVTLGEVHGSRVEVVSELKKDTWIVGQGAILLKPFLIASLAKK